MRFKSMLGGFAMTPSEESSGTTRQRVLASASELFAEKGYHETTVADICERAGANVAAVNYYFGSKENLYREVWFNAERLADEAYPLFAAPADAAPEECLRAFILAIVRSSLCEGKGGWFARLAAHEHPGERAGQKDFVRDTMFGIQGRVEAIMAKVLGRAATPQANRLCMMSVMSQIGFINQRRSMVRHHLFGDGRPDERQVRSLAEHVARFALGGIREVRRYLEEQGGGADEA